MKWLYRLNDVFEKVKQMSDNNGPLHLKIVVPNQPRKKSITIHQTRTSLIRENLPTKRSIVRTDSSDDLHCGNSRRKLHNPKHSYKDDSSVKNRVGHALPTLQQKYELIFNGQAIFWKHRIPAQVSLFYHLEFDCIEISAFDLLLHREMDRLYVTASRIFDLVEDMVDLSEYKSRKVSLSELIKSARLNCTIDFIMAHISCEKVAFMPAVPTIRSFNGLFVLLYLLSP